MDIKISDVINWHQSCGYETRNFDVNLDQKIIGPRAIEVCDESNISFITKKYESAAVQIVADTKCQVIIIPEQLLKLIQHVNHKVFLLSENPKTTILKFCQHFMDFGAANTTTKIHPTAVIETGAAIGNNVIIGANAFVSSNSVIGNNCTIGACTVIENCSIGNNVKIGCNNTLGGNGFGYSKSSDSDKNELFPHYGRVVIHDNVDIGNNTCIDRGSLSDTIIDAGVKIDNLVHIAHNVYIGKNSLIIASAMVAGSVHIGENCWIAPNSNIKNGIKIGKNSTIGMASTVTKDLKESQTVAGSPAMTMDDFNTLRKIQKDAIANHDIPIRN